MKNIIKKTFKPIRVLQLEKKIRTTKGKLYLCSKFNKSWKLDILC